VILNILAVIKTVVSQRGKRRMNSKVIKKLRKQYREKINSFAMRDLKNEIFRLARNRDILGIVLIAENIFFAILFIFLIFRK
jgi:hypothetical protein